MHDADRNADRNTGTVDATLVRSEVRAAWKDAAAADALEHRQVTGDINAQLARGNARLDELEARHGISLNELTAGQAAYLTSLTECKVRAAAIDAEAKKVKAVAAKALEIAGQAIDTTTESSQKEYDTLEALA